MRAPGAPSPPRLAQALVRMLPAAENHSFLAADLAEEFDDLAATAGTAAARRWYWKQTCLSVAPLVRHRVSTLVSSLMKSVAPAERKGRRFMFQSFTTDLRYAWRMGRRAPIVTFSVMLAIALGIAASTAIISVMEGLFLRPLPFPAPDRLVRFSTTVENLGQAPEVNYLDAQDWRPPRRTSRRLACTMSRPERCAWQRMPRLSRPRSCWRPRMCCRCSACSP